MIIFYSTLSLGLQSRKSHREEGLGQVDIKAPFGGDLEGVYKFPLSSCSLSIDSNSALKFPLPKDLAPARCMIS